MSRTNELLTVAEVARWLRVDRRTVYRWLRGGELPHRRVGQEYRFLRSEIEAWLRRRTEQ
jgi:excisionase family DNA binding protein